MPAVIVEPFTAHWTKLFSAADIQARIAEAGKQIRRDCGSEEIVMIGILNSAVMFLADLARTVASPVRLDTMLVQSYGAGRVSSGQVELVHDVQQQLAGRHVLLVDDVYDSGRTLHFAVQHLRAKQPKSLKVACLLVKDKPRAAEVDVTYGLFSIPDDFVVGYGMDLAGLGRNLPDLWIVPPNVSEG